MQFAWLVAVTMLGACGTSPDARPQTFEFIALEVLAPACGTVACHSSSTHAKGFAFDTLDDARAALRSLVTPGNPEASRIYDVISGSRNPQMPPDAPMATQDIDLVRAWISAGAPGL